MKLQFNFFGSAFALTHICRHFPNSTPIWKLHWWVHLAGAERVHTGIDRPHEYLCDNSFSRLLASHSNLCMRPTGKLVGDTMSVDGSVCRLDATLMSNNNAGPQLILCSRAECTGGAGGAAQSAARPPPQSPASGASVM